MTRDKVQGTRKKGQCVAHHATVCYAPSSRRLSKGFTLLELVIVICISAVLMLTFLNRVLFYQEQVERAAMIGVVTAVQSSLNMQQLGLLLQNEETKIAALAKDNPINWLDDKPRNYVGEYFDPALDAIAPGNWAFDLKSRELIYVPDYTRHISFTGDGKKWIRFRVKLVEGVAKEASGKGNVVGISFGPVDPYHWEI